MKQFLLVSLFFFIVSFFPVETHAITMPCSMVLTPTDKSFENAMGTALVYRLQLNPASFERTNISIIAVHLPEPSSFGNYDRYEGFTFKPKEISWRFKLHPTPEMESPTWAGRIGHITAPIDNVYVQVRLSNSKNEKLGPSILSSHFKFCK